MKYGLIKSTKLSFEDAINKVTQELQKEGFGVLTTIDVQQTLKKKLNVDFQKYIILGACNPPFAHRALLAEDEIGLLLPCNVIVYEKGGATNIAIFDPQVITKIVDKPEIHALAQEVRTRLERIMAVI